MKKIRINGKKYKVERYIEVKNKDEVIGSIPLLSVTMMSDYKWQLQAMKDRLQNSYKYSNENISDVLNNLKEWLLNNTTKALHKHYCKEFKICYDFIFEAKEAK